MRLEEILAGRLALAGFDVRDSPYGDGKASPRCLAAIRCLFGSGRTAARFREVEPRTCPATDEETS